MSRARVALAAVTLAALLVACATGPATPAAIIPSLDGWDDLGLTCAPPTVDEVPSGLLQWSCHGTVGSADLTAVLDGDEKGVFEFVAQVPVGTSLDRAVIAFGDLVAATPAVAGDPALVRSWLRAWDGSGTTRDFGTARMSLESDATWLTLVVSPGPRRSVDDPVP